MFPEVLVDLKEITRMSAMGGSGGGDDEENPFLFKKFVAKKHRPGEQSDEEDEKQTGSSKGKGFLFSDVQTRE